jgi:hypothetical protein
LKGRITVSDAHHRLHNELAIADLERAADEYRTMAATTSTASDRDRHTRVADRFERIVEQRKQAVPRRLP